MPFSTLLPCTIEEIHETIETEASDPDLQLVRKCTELARSRLNATDRGRPPAAGSTAETLYREGLELHALCSEHAILVNEIVQPRVLWYFVIGVLTVAGFYLLVRVV